MGFIDVVAMFGLVLLFRGIGVCIRVLVLLVKMGFG